MFRQILAVVAVVVLSAGGAAAFETNARAAFVLDLTTNTVLYEKDAHTPIPPASMSKLMTLTMLFEALRDGRVTLDTRFGVSSRAKAMGGSTMFLDETDRPSVEELIQGIIVLSGNDACVVVAEGLAGSEDAFARLMNERAKALGLTESTFANSTGWPDPVHRVSVHDLGMIAAHIITDFPEYYGYFSEEEFDFDGRAPQNRFNRNPLLKLGIGADGLKTGHTTEAGYGLVGSAVQGDRRIVFVLSGLPTEKDRAEEAERVANWAFRQFVEKTVMPGGTTVTEAPVWLGDHTRIGLVTRDDVSILLPAVEQGALNAEVVFRGPIEAPIIAGEPYADLVIARAGMEDARIPLVADRDVRRGGFVARLRTSASVLVRRLSEAAQGYL